MNVVRGKALRSRNVQFSENHLNLGIFSHLWTMRISALLLIFSIITAGCFTRKGRHDKSADVYKLVYMGDSTLPAGEWIEISYAQSKDFNTNLIQVYHQNDKMSFVNYLNVMGANMTYPLYLQKVKMEGNAIYTVKREGENLNMAMSAGTLNRSYSEMARWIMPIRYGVPSQHFGPQDSVMFQIRFRRKVQ